MLHTFGNKTGVSESFAVAYVHVSRKKHENMSSNTLNCERILNCVLTAELMRFDTVNALQWL